MFLLFMFVVLSFAVEDSNQNSQIQEQNLFDSILRAQCQAKCIEKFGHNFVKRTKSGQSYEQVRCDGTCQPCWLGCVLRVQTEDLCQKKCLEAKEVASCNEGCKYQFELIQYNNNVPIHDDYRFIDSVTLLCMNMNSNNDVFGRFVISINNNHSSINTSLPVVFVIQIQQRAFSIIYRQYTKTQWYSLGTRDMRTFVLKKMLPGMEYRLRVIAVHSNGTLGEFVNSDWIRTISIDQILNKPTQLALSQQFMTGNELNAVIDWQADHYYPTCFYHIVWHNTNTAHSRSIIVDESMSYMLFDLDYGSNYTVTIRSLSHPQHPREESQPIGLMFTSLDCLSVHNYNFSICGPGPVTDLEYKRVNSTFILSFSKPKYTTPWNGVLAYSIYYRSLPHLGSCKNNVEKSLRIEPNETRVSLNVSSNCYYQASITAIGKNDKSGVVSYISFNYSIPNVSSSLSDVMIPFHPAYFIVVLISVLVLVSVIGVVYLRLNKTVTQVNKKNPLVHQMLARPP